MHDDPLVALGVPVLGRVLDEVVADREHDVGVLEARHRVVARLEADGAERARVGVVEDALAHERLRDGDAGRAGELAQRRRRAGADDAVAGQDDRVDRVADDVGRAQELAGAGLRGREAPARQRLGVELLGHDVLGQLEVRRARLLGLGDLERLADDLGDDLRALTRAFHFVIGCMRPTMSRYWWDSLCIRSMSPWPVMATSGARSRYASATAVTRFVAPGPSVPRQTPARPVSRPYMSAM